MKSEKIAKLAGVSRSTVSRVINNYPNVPQETREKVMKVIEKYHYEPNTCARVLAGKATNTIGLFVISMTDQENPNRIYQNNYFAPFVDAVVDCANVLGYYVLIHTVYRTEDYLKVKQAFSQKRIDAGIMIGTEKDQEILHSIVEMGYPTAIIDYDAEEITAQEEKYGNLVIINSTDYEGTTQAINYLIQLGHRDIGIIKGRLNTYSGKVRFAAYVDALEKKGLPVNEDFIIEGAFLKKAAYEGTEKMVHRGKLPTALFSSNDDMALSAMEVFKYNGIRVPEDISVIGFDDVPVISQITPALTSVKVPVYEMAKKAVEAVIEMHAQEQYRLQKYVVRTELMLRETCAKAKMM